jgi:hypothetical protein
MAESISQMNAPLIAQRFQATENKGDFIDITTNLTLGLNFATALHPLPSSP